MAPNLAFGLLSERFVESVESTARQRLTLWQCSSVLRTVHQTSMSPRWKLALTQEHQRTVFGHLQATDRLSTVRTERI